MAAAHGCRRTFAPHRHRGGAGYGKDGSVPRSRTLATIVRCSAKHQQDEPDNRDSQKPGPHRHQPDTHLLLAFGLDCAIRSRRRLPSFRRCIGCGGTRLRRNFMDEKGKPWQACGFHSSAIVGPWRRHRQTVLCVVVCRCCRHGPYRPPRSIWRPRRLVRQLPGRPAGFRQILSAAPWQGWRTTGPAALAPQPAAMEHRMAPAAAPAP